MLVVLSGNPGVKALALSASDPDMPEWDGLSDDEKKLHTRMMEVMAGFVSHADHHFRRILDFLEEIGEVYMDRKGKVTYVWTIRVYTLSI